MPITINIPAWYPVCNLGSSGYWISWDANDFGICWRKQYEKPKDQGSFFNWYFLTASTGTIISATAIIYTQDNAGWKLGFGLCAAANLISFIIFISGKRLYKHDKPMGSPFTSLLRVLVSAIAKRKAVISSKDEVYYHGGLGEKDETSAVMPSKSFR